MSEIHVIHIETVPCGRCRHCDRERKICDMTGYDTDCPDDGCHDGEVV